MSIVITDPTGVIDHRLDQTSGVQTGGSPDKDDWGLSSNLSELPDTFENFLESASLNTAITQTQLDNAATYEAAYEDSGAGYFIGVSTTTDNETINDLYFSQSNGTLFDGSQQAMYNGNPIYVAGETDPIYLYSFEGGDILIGTTQSDATAGDITTLDGDDIVFAYYLQEYYDGDGNPEGADIWGVTFQPLEHEIDGDGESGEFDDTIDFGDFLYVSASGTLSFEFDTLESGKFLWVAVGDDSAGLLVTGKDLNVQDAGPHVGDRVNGGPDPSDAMNTSQGGLGATIGVNNQMWTVGNEGVFTLVTGYTELGGGPDATGDNVNEIQYDDYINTQGAGIFISQTQGNTPIDMTIGVWQAGGNDTTYTDPSLLTEEEGSGLGGYIGAEDADGVGGGNDGTSGAFEDDYAVDVDTVTVYGADGTTVIGTWDADDATNGTMQGGVTVTINDNMIDVDGLEPLYTVSWTVYDDETFNRFTLAADDGKFDVGRVDVAQGVIVSEDIGNEVLIHDDGPSAVITDTGIAVVHDESAGLQNDPLEVAIIDGAPGDISGDDLSVYFGGIQDGDTLSINGELVFTYGLLEDGVLVSDLETAIVNADVDGITTAHVDAIEGDLIVVRLGSTAVLEFSGEIATGLGLLPAYANADNESDIVEDGNDDDQTLASLPAGFPANPIGWAMSAEPVVSSETSSYGTDGAGTEEWELVLWDSVAGDFTGADVDSGLDTLDGYDILLNVEGDYIVGRIDDNEDGNVEGGDDIALVIAIDGDGYLSVAQYVPIAHLPDTGIDQRADIDDNVLFAQLTVTDDDGDFDVDQFDIGNKVIIEDDGPTPGSLDAEVLEEDDLDGTDNTAPTPDELSTGNHYDAGGGADQDGVGDGSGTRTSVTTTLAALVADTGADDPVSIALDSDLTDGALDSTDLTTYGLPTLYSKGDAITYVVDTTAGTITGYADYTGDDRVVFVFTVTDNGDGTGDVNFTIYDQIDHAAYGDDIENELLVTDPASDWDNSGDSAVDEIDFTPLVDIEDADTDPVILGAGSIAYAIQDDIPIIAENLDGTPNLIADGAVDFSTITGANPAEADNTSIASVTNSLNGLIGTDENDDNNLAGDGTTYTYTFNNYTDPTGDPSSYIAGLQVAELTYQTDEGTYLTFAGDDYVLTTDPPTALLYYVDGVGGTAGVYDDGIDTPYYLMALDQTANSGAGAYTFTVLTNPPDAFQPFDFEDLPSGQNLFGVIAADKTDEGDGGLLLFPKDAVLDGDGVFTTGQNSSPTTNTSKGGGPVTIGNTNQMFDPGEGHYFIYVEEREDASTAGIGLDQNNSDDADTLGFTGTTEVTAAEVEIVQVQGGGLASFKITAYDLDLDGVEVDSNEISGPDTGTIWSRDFMLDPVTEAGTEATPKIVMVTVYDNSDPDNPVVLEQTAYDYGTTTQTWTVDDDGNTGDGQGGDIQITFNPDGTVNVEGVDDDYKIAWETDIDHDMVLIEGTGGKYDIGGFNLLQDLSTPDQTFDFDVTITDFDGDQDTSNEFSIIVDGTGTFDDDTGQV